MLTGLLGSWNIAFSASGHDADDMTAEAWDATAFAGSLARYRIYDTHQAGWGHIAVDNIVCSSCTRGPTCAGWTKTSPGCVSGHNMDVHPELRDPDPAVGCCILLGQTVAQCKQLCADTPGCLVRFRSLSRHVLLTFC